MRFLLWDVFGLEADLHDSGPDRELTDRILDRAKDYAYDQLGVFYQAGDRQACRLSNGQVRLPDGFEGLWASYRREGWGCIGLPENEGGLGLPYAVSMAVMEMFYGANPAFMTLSGFCLPLYYLLKRFGSHALQNDYCGPLLSNQWSACLCMTEPQAGSDVGAISTKATPLSGDGLYSIKGKKVFISAGSQELTENIVYVVLARIAGARPGTIGLSCFLVPRYRIGDGADNGVRCLRLEEKMGFHACPTAELEFGQEGECVGHLLGEVPNRGLLQLLSMMNHARIATGIYALGMASSAYLNAAEYAAERLQGCHYRQVFNPVAPRVPIIEHADVRRMLFDMKTRVEGCRMLIYRLAVHLGRAQNLRAQGADAAQLAPHENLVNLLTPVVKAYVSDTAWHVADRAIQVHGGYGYTQDFPVEQYARDIKVLSIWEGTNHIQAVDLLRDKFGFGRSEVLSGLLAAHIRDFIKGNDSPIVGELGGQLESALSRLLDTLGRIYSLLRENRMEQALLHANTVLRMTAEVVLAWGHLESAAVAQDRLAAAPEAERAFYEGKILGARYVFANDLPKVFMDAERIVRADDSPLLAGDALRNDIECARHNPSFLTRAHV
ncbi:MAG: acyl-CoA dehydrogenase [Azoarcus sp.]|jgi:alkylation response protein AidB-like acyl-CoA dehydrogenase|nr:acyl-CoA dehydrogenase [Azoarcus sp.]